MSCTRRWATPVVDSNCRALLHARYTAIGDSEMAAESLAEVVRSLTPQEQDAVRQFIDATPLGLVVAGSLPEPAAKVPPAAHQLLAWMSYD